jgi:hypothetical protein
LFADDDVDEGVDPGYAMGVGGEREREIGCEEREGKRSTRRRRWLGEEGRVRELWRMNESNEMAIPTCFSPAA